MREIAYLFERFPSFGQTFCYREVAEMERQGAKLRLYSIRHPTDEPEQDWDKELVRRVHYLPEEKILLPEVERTLRSEKALGDARQAVEKWGRQSDFLRLYQAIYLGTRLQQNGVDRVHSHFAGMAARTAFWINQFFGIPFSFTAHANDIFAPRDFVISLDKLMETAAAIVTVSDYAREFLRNGFPQSAAKIHRVYNGVELSRFNLASFKSALPSIVSVGRLIEKKGFADLIDACRLLKEAGREFVCDIIGEGPLEARLRDQIEKADLESCVRLAGPQTQAQIAARLADAAVFVLPCTREQGGGMDNLPTVIMEAMAAGLPVISTPLGGVPEMVEQDVTGGLVPEHDPGALAAAIERLLADPARAKKLGQRGREVARDKFSIEGNVRELRALFGNL